MSYTITTYSLRTNINGKTSTVVFDHIKGKPWKLYVANVFASLNVNFQINIVILLNLPYTIWQVYFQSEPASCNRFVEFQFPVPWDYDNHLQFFTQFLTLSILLKNSQFWRNILRKKVFFSLSLSFSTLTFFVLN